MILSWFIGSILISSTSIWGSYLCAKVAWIDYTKNCLEFFSEEVNFTNIPLLIKEHKCKYLSPFIFFAIIFAVYYSFMIYINWILLWKMIIYDFIIIIISYIGFSVFLSLYWKKIKALSIQTKTKSEAIINFQKYQNKMKKKQIKMFKVYKNGHININNNRFQLNQKLYRWRIKRLLKKKISQEKCDFKLLKIYITYLKVYSAFFKSIKYSGIFIRKIRPDFYNYYIVLENNTNESWENLPKILINNFFAFVNQAEQEFKNKH